MAKEIKSDYKVIGVMAGSSMDGLDVAEVFFSKSNGWHFEVGRHETIGYDQHIEILLKSAVDLGTNSQKEIDDYFGEWIGKQLEKFGTKDCDLISVHGHTLIHKPGEGISWQLGRGDIIAKLTASTVISDLRSLDVQLGGQGAPLVAIGDFELFDDFEACLNLGGIANVSVQEKKMAWDICPCNQILNGFAEKLGHPFDEGGQLARQGNVEGDWMKEISTVPFFSKKSPKSLPNSFIGKKILDKIDPLDGLRTYSEFMATLIVSDLKDHLVKNSRILVTGGGGHNSYLVELLNQNEHAFAFALPEKKIIEFKEAIIFGFLGLLRFRNETNVMASVTGATRDSSSGVIHYPK